MSGAGAVEALCTGALAGRPRRLLLCRVWSPATRSIAAFERGGDELVAPFALEVSPEWKRRLRFPCAVCFPAGSRGKPTKPLAFPCIPASGPAMPSLRFRFVPARESIPFR
ncbi:hypothetical protein SPI_01684 [Niveomyces insectorum RCEF 264]|uniref:Uncharacterized protein n=1 Tax=Niveomyces insectorum RCEF 264 TaxID=1081102 RepID=A0A167Z592_9HYPO|nr:hypothetical protein SPI_01684 [Niveomyces insectorum RCEF 264]